MISLQAKASQRPHGLTCRAPDMGVLVRGPLFGTCRVPATGTCCSSTCSQTRLSKSGPKLHRLELAVSLMRKQHPLLSLLTIARLALVLGTYLHPLTTPGESSQTTVHGIFFFFSFFHLLDLLPTNLVLRIGRYHLMYCFYYYL